ncbi:MAG: hypothetical protein WBX38_10140 [Candidatus Sulfotelmatobacter sp.]
MSDLAPKSTPRNAGASASSDAKAAFDAEIAPARFSVPDLGSIGPYRLIRKLGEGGMGEVWLAEQSAPVKRQVALKIIKAARYDKSALIRFDLERQALAIMDHPAIAKVFDAGSTPEGHPTSLWSMCPACPLQNTAMRSACRQASACLKKGFRGGEVKNEVVVITGASAGFASQQTSEPEDPYRPDNLWNPLGGDHGAHGTFDDQAHERSWEVQASLGQRWIGAGLAMFAAALLLASRRG